MFKHITIDVKQPILDSGSELEHYATSYEIRNKPTLDEDSILYTSLRDTNDLLIKRLKLDVNNGEVIFFRTAYHFKNKVTNEITDEPYSRFISARSDQDGFTISDVIVATPIVTLVKEKLMDGSYDLVFKTNAFKMYSGIGSHNSTSWLITDTDGKPILTRRHDESNLTQFIINSKDINSDKNYIMKAIHHTTTGGNSLEGRLLFTLHVTESKLYDIKQVGSMIANRLLYFKVIAYTAMYDTVDIIIKNRAGNIVLENLNQRTLTPSIMIEGLNLYETYYIYGRITLKNGYKTNYKLISTNILEDNLLVLPKDGIKYLGKFDYLQEELLNGQTVQSSSEFYNGVILLSKHDDKSLYRYRMYNDKLVEVGKLTELETGDGENIGIPYINILPMHSGNFIVSYCYDNAGVDEAKHVICHYDYNATSNKLKLLNSTIHKDELYGTAGSSSAVIDKNDNMYYIPANIVDSDGNKQPLALYCFNTTTHTRNKVANLPFKVYDNVTLSITRDNDLIIFGGTDETGIIKTDSDVTIYRTNNDIYKFDIKTSTFNKIGEIPNIPNTVYRFQSYLRRDGCIVAFNSVSSGISVGDQTTLVINPMLQTVTTVDSDMSDNLAYRNSVVLRTGDILRISNLDIDPQVVYRYVSDTMKITDIDENTVTTEMIKDLVVDYNEVITIEEPWLYDSITIKGNSDEDTGILRWVSNTETYEYDYRTLIVTRDTKHDSLLTNEKDYEKILIIGAKTATINYYERPNPLVVPAGETVTIFDPYIYTKIVVEGTSMDDTGTLIWISGSETRYYYYDTLWITRSDILDSDIINSRKYSHCIQLDNTSPILL